MEINKSNIYICDPSFHNNHQSNVKSASAKTRPHGTLRRRCRSECLQMIPVLGTPLLSGDQPNQPPPDDRSLQNKTTNRRNIFSKTNNHISSHNNSAQQKNHTKENMLLDMLSSQGIHDGYLIDMEKYKEKQMSVNLMMNGKLVGNGKYLDQNQLSGDSYAVDINKRRVRTRSESEPHEIYNTKYTAINENRRIYEDINLKRPRDDTNPILHTNGIFTHPENDKEDDLVVHSNPNHARLINGEKNIEERVNKAQLTHLKNVAWSRSKRSPTPTFNSKSATVRLGSTTRSKSAKTLQSSSQEKDTTSQADTGSTESYPESDAECSSLDDDDDFGEIGEDVEVEITDDEESAPPQMTVDATGISLLNTSAQTAESVQGGSVTGAPLAPSLFPNCPPYITFASHEEKGPEMPTILQKILKWKLTLITPIVVRRVLINSGFKLLKKTNDWMGTWGKHMKSPCFKTIRSYQKINHIPGTFQIGRKDRIWRNLQTQMARHGKKEFNFMPRTYIIPHDLKLLRQAWPKYQQKNTKWIMKPPAAARGTGIKVVNRWSQIPKKRPLVIQKYVDRPLLINGSKFDLRLYILVTSISPLRIYMHTDGLARFASVKYSEKSETLNDRYMHLTNYSINKLSSNYTKNEDANACKGHKWTVKSLWTYLSAQGINTKLLWAALRNLVLRTVLAGEGPIYALTKLNTNSKYNCYELFGIDVILDSELIPWLLEVNISPSLHSASPLDMAVKGPLVQALLNTALYQVPPKLTNVEQIDILNELGLHQQDQQLCYDRRIFITQLSETERIKHNQFANRNMVNRDEYLKPILENLTPDDVRCLLVTEDELSRCAPLERIFPAPNSHKYLNFTDNPRYYNRLLDAWETRYSKKRQEGIKLLRSLCESEVHLQVPPQSLGKDSSNNDESEENVGELETEKNDESVTDKRISPASKTVAATKTEDCIKDSSDINGIKTLNESEEIDDTAVIKVN